MCCERAYQSDRVLTHRGAGAAPCAPTGHGEAVSLAERGSMLRSAAASPRSSPGRSVPPCRSFASARAGAAAGGTSAHRATSPASARRTWRGRRPGVRTSCPGMISSLTWLSSSLRCPGIKRAAGFNTAHGPCIAQLRGSSPRRHAARGHDHLHRHTTHDAGPEDDHRVVQHHCDTVPLRRAIARNYTQLCYHARTPASIARAPSMV